MAVERWTDEMLDKFAGKVDLLAEKVDHLGEKVDRIAEEVEQTNNNVDALVGAVNSLVTLLREEIPAIKSGQEETANIQAESIRELIKFINKPKSD